MSISHNEFVENVSTIKTNRYGSEIRRSIYENFEYLDENGGSGGVNWTVCTQTEYDNMSSHDPQMLYIIIEDPIE